MTSRQSRAARVLLSNLLEDGSSDRRATGGAGRVASGYRRRSGLVQRNQMLAAASWSAAEAGPEQCAMTSATCFDRSVRYSEIGQVHRIEDMFQRHRDGCY